jgi:hypothetical protein
VNYRRALAGVAVVLAVVVAGCRSREGARGLVQPPLFQQAPGQPAEILFSPVTAAMPAGGATIRIWTRVTNPNRFGFTLNTLRTTLLLEGARAATGEFPLGLALEAEQSTIVPIELTLNFADAPALTPIARSALTSDGVEYRLDGMVGVDAGQLGQPTFGPLPLLRGELRARRMTGER